MIVLISSFIAILYALALTTFYLTFRSEKFGSIEFLEPVAPGSDSLRPTKACRHLLIAASNLLPIIIVFVAVCIFLFPEIAWSTGLLMPFLGSFTYFVIVIIFHAEWWTVTGNRILSDLMISGIVLLLLVTLFKSQYVTAIFLQPLLEKMGANTPDSVTIFYITFIGLLSAMGIIFFISHSRPQIFLFAISIVFILLAGWGVYLIGSILR